MYNVYIMNQPRTDYRVSLETFGVCSAFTAFYFILIKVKKVQFILLPSRLKNEKVFLKLFQFPHLISVVSLSYCT